MAERFIVTVCTASYLGQAKTMADSVILHDPGYKVVIGLVDKLDAKFDRSVYDPHWLLEVHELNLPQFHGMCERYNTLELSCALKSHFVNWLLKNHQPEFIIYLDADILVYDSFAPVDKLLQQNSFLITPHITSPFGDHTLRPREKDILKTGMFNAGFFVVKNDAVGNAIIEWWKERMVDQAYERPKEGLNIDQNWLNFVPLYFQPVHSVREPGINVAYWNLHERTITKSGSRYLINGEPLIFFHFSGYSLQYPKKLSRHQDRINPENQPALAELLGNYHDILIRNKHTEILKTPFYYAKKKGLLSRLGIKSITGN